MSLMPRVYAVQPQFAHTSGAVGQIWPTWPKMWPTWRQESQQTGLWGVVTEDVTSPIQEGAWRRPFKQATVFPTSKDNMRTVDRGRIWKVVMQKLGPKYGRQEVPSKQSVANRLRRRKNNSDLSRSLSFSPAYEDKIQAELERYRQSRTFSTWKCEDCGNGVSDNAGCETCSQP